MQNEEVEQLAANRLTIPQEVIASLPQRLVLPALLFKPLPDPKWITASVNHGRYHHDVLAQAVVDAERESLGEGAKVPMRFFMDATIVHKRFDV